MPIRQATWADLAPASRLVGHAFFDDPFSGQFMRPNRHTYPLDPARSTLRKLRLAFFTPNATIIIAHGEKLIADPDTDITGVSVWTRTGEVGKAIIKSQSWLGWLAMKFMSLFNIVHEKIYPDRSLDKVRNALYLSHPIAKHFFEEPPSRKESFFLDLCATSPEAQGKGYGREMLLWGVRRAREQGVTAGLVASTIAESFYYKFGFRRVGYASEGEGNPFGHISGGAIMFLEDRKDGEIEEVRKDM